MPPSPSRHTVWHLVRQFTHLFAVMLRTAAALAFVAGMPQLATAVIVVLLVHGLLSFVQEYRADGAAAGLRALVPARATVVRDGQP